MSGWDTPRWVKSEERAAGADVEEAGGIGEGQRAEDYGVDHREEGSVGAAAESLGDNGDNREAGNFANGAGLLIAESHQRIYAHGAARWDVAGG